MNDIQGTLNVLLSIEGSAKPNCVLGGSWVQAGPRAKGWLSFLLPFLSQPVSNFNGLGSPLPQRAEISIPSRLGFPEIRIQ